MDSLPELCASVTKFTKLRKLGWNRRYQSTSFPACSAGLIPSSFMTTSQEGIRYEVCRVAELRVTKVSFRIFGREGWNSFLFWASWIWLFRWEQHRRIWWPLPSMVWKKTLVRYFLLSRAVVCLEETFILLQRGCGNGILTESAEKESHAEKEKSFWDVEGIGKRFCSMQN